MNARRCQYWLKRRPVVPTFTLDLDEFSNHIEGVDLQSSNDG
jgi:hypothetical protein